MRGGNPFVAWLLGWLLPGAGHLYLGRRAQGFVLMGALCGAFAAGALLSRGAALSGDSPEYLVLQAGCGLPAGIAWLLRETAATDVDVATRETAVLYTLVPALLNLVVALDAAARAAGGETSPGGDPGGPPQDDGDEGAFPPGESGEAELTADAPGTSAAAPAGEAP